jgi:hypothetical protein
MLGVPATAGRRGAAADEVIAEHAVAAPRRAAGRRDQCIERCSRICAPMPSVARDAQAQRARLEYSASVTRPWPAP